MVFHPGPPFNVVVPNLLKDHNFMLLFNIILGTFPKTVQLMTKEVYRTLSVGRVRVAYEVSLLSYINNIAERYDLFFITRSIRVYFRSC